VPSINFERLWRQEMDEKNLIARLEAFGPADLDDARERAKVAARARAVRGTGTRIACKSRLSDFGISVDEDRW
jgi:hypothetical protein